MNASLREIVLSVRFGEASLVGESVGYLVLGACDRALAVPRVVDLDGVLVTSEGEVVLDANPASEAEAERSLRYLLAQLLTLLRSPFPNLARVAAREPCGLEHLVTELEAALVPVNRRAARRSLSRLVREARRSLADERRQAAVVDVIPAPQAAPAIVAIAPPPASPPAIPKYVAEPAPASFEPSAAFQGDDRQDDEVRDEVPSLLFEPVTAIFAPACSEHLPFDGASLDAAAFDADAPDPADDSWAPAEAHSPSLFPVHVSSSFPAVVSSAPAAVVSSAPAAVVSSAPAVRVELSASPVTASLFDDTSSDVLGAAVDDAFDHALTRVASAVETLPPPESRPPSRFNLRRLAPSPAVEGPLIPTLIPSASRPSSIEDLLLGMRVEGEPGDVVLASLALLARVDVSPVAPPVG